MNWLSLIALIPKFYNKIKEWLRGNEVSNIKNAIDNNDDKYISRKLSEIKRKEQRRTAGKS